MFTGIVEAKGEVVGSEAHDGVTRLTITHPTDWDLNIGQSISVNGVCLTVTEFTDSSFTVEMMTETLSKTIFGLSVPSVVNLERAMLATDRFEGHIVQGHVDTVGEVKAVRASKENHVLAIMYDSKYSNLVVPKGSITIDGVSLTVTTTAVGLLSVALIPHTLKETTLGERKEGDRVNLEFDIIGKYVTRKM